MPGLNETLRVSLVMDSSKYQSGAKKAAKATDGISESAKKTKQPLSGMTNQLKGLAPALGAAAVVAGIKSTIDAAVRLNESVNAVDKIFGAAGETIYAFGETSAEAVGLAQSEFQQMSVTTGALFTGLGLSQQEAADKTVELTQRAADMASVFNTDVTDALFAIQAGLRGETEPLRRFGVTLDAAGLSAAAVAQGLAATTGEVTKEMRALVAFDEVLRQTNSSAGDFADTSDQLANQQRIFSAKMEDSKAKIGQGLLPAMTAITEVAISLLPVIEDVGIEFANLVDAAAPILKIPLWLAETRTELRKFADEAADDDSLWEQFQRGAGDILSTTLVESVETFYDNIIGRFIDDGPEAVTALQEVDQAYRDSMWAAQGAAQAGRDAADAEAEQEEALAKLIGPYKQYSALMRYGIDGNEDLAGAVDESTDAYRKQKNAILAAARAQREASDPVFAKIQAEKRLTEAQLALNEVIEAGTTDGAEYTDALLDVIEAQNDVDYASAELSTSLGSSIDAFREQAEAAGLNREQIDLLIAAMYGIPDVTAGIEIQWSQTGRPEAVEGLTEGVDYIIGGGTIGFAAGGRPPVGVPVMVGERGKELFVPDRPGTIVPNHALGRGGETVVNIHRVESDDLAGDISEGLTMAAIAEQIDLIGDF